MRLLADECCDASLVAALRMDGYDVIYAAETLQRLPDAGILERAVEDERILLTEERISESWSTGCIVRPTA